jgi:hypothetical protein
MDKGGAPEGNHNAKKGKLFYEQLRKVLVQNDALRLRRIADKLVESAEKGEPWAVKEVMDRVDGKATQSTDITTDGTPLSNILVSFVKPNE